MSLIWQNIQDTKVIQWTKNITLKKFNIKLHKKMAH
jgi:hypothetical protein